MNLNNQLYYNRKVEIFMVLKDVHTSYTFGSGGELKKSPNIKDQQVTVYWKPPGALQWLLKYKTEILPGKSNFVWPASLLLDFEEVDASSVSLKFEIRQLETGRKGSDLDKRCELMSLYSTVITTLDQILSTGSKGQDVTLKLDFGIPDTLYLTKQYKKCSPVGTLFIRGETIQPCDFGVSLQFGIQSEKSADYFLELHKLNQDNAFEHSHPYTLVYRTDMDEILYSYPTSCQKIAYFPESKLSNGDFDRVLKLDIYKKENWERKGFALTTLGSLLKEQTQILNVDRVDSFHPYPYKKKELKVILKIGAKIPIHPIEHYFQLGWKIVPVFAVDFSRSNWNEDLHKRVLHDGALGRAPYEEALELCAEAINKISGENAVFYGFGCTVNTYMNLYRPASQYTATAFKNYQDALCLSLMSSLTVTQERSPMDGGASSSISSSSSASFSSPMFLSSGSLLSPLLNDLSALISARKRAYEYYTVIILTDGQFTDSDKYMRLMIELSILPVSLIFIGIGLGEFKAILELEESMNRRTSSRSLARKFVRLLHFRSRCHWDAAIAYDKYKTISQDIFVKEILTTVHTHALEFFKKYFDEIKNC